MDTASGMSGDEDGVSADSYGLLDTSKVNEDCWLIRVPHKLAELWEKAPEGTDLGELLFTKLSATVKKPILELKVADELVEDLQKKDHNKSGSLPAPLPQNYSLEAMTKKIPKMFPFERNEKNGSCSILGMVSRTANLQVKQDKSYRALLKDRLVSSNLTSTRFVKPTETSDSVMSKQRSATNSKRPDGFGASVSKLGQRLLEVAEQPDTSDQQGATKKTRQFAPDEPIRSVIFTLFGLKDFWAVKDVKSAAVSGGATHCGTKQGEAEIREILKDIGVYHRNGEHKNMWELKPELRQQK